MRSSSLLGQRDVRNNCSRTLCSGRESLWTLGSVRPGSAHGYSRVHPSKKYVKEKFPCSWSLCSSPPISWKSAALRRHVGLFFLVNFLTCHLQPPFCSSFYFLAPVLALHVVFQSFWPIFSDGPFICTHFGYCTRSTHSLAS